MPDRLRFPRRGVLNDPNHQYNLSQMERWSRQTGSELEVAQADIVALQDELGLYVPASAFTDSGQVLQSSAAGVYAAVEHGGDSQSFLLHDAPSVSNKGHVVRMGNLGDRPLWAISDSSLWHVQVPTTVDALASSHSYNNMTGERILFESDSADGDTLEVGTAYRLRAWGGIDHRATADTFTFRPYLFGVTPGAIALTMDLNARTDREWYLETDFRIKTVGASGLFFGTTRFWSNYKVATNLPEAHLSGGAGATGSAFDSTAGGTVKLTGEMSVASSNNTIRCNGATLEVVYHPNQ